MDKRQEDPSLNSRKEEKMEISESRGSPELRRKSSRSVAVREDAIRLKTATLDRMGKIFKLKSTRTTDSPDEITNSHDVDEHTRKNKTNSLGRMFKLVDKNGEPRRLFDNSRNGTIGRMFRRKSTGTDNEENSSVNSNNIGVFSRMLNQWKHRSANGNSTVEPNLCASFPEKNKIPSTNGESSNSGENLSSSCKVPNSAMTKSSLVKSADVEYPA